MSANETTALPIIMAQGQIASLSLAPINLSGVSTVVISTDPDNPFYLGTATCDPPAPISAGASGDGPIPSVALDGGNGTDGKTGQVRFY